MLKTAKTNFIKVISDKIKLYLDKPNKLAKINIILNICILALYTFDWIRFYDYGINLVDIPFIIAVVLELFYFVYSAKKNNDRFNNLLLISIIIRIILMLEALFGLLFWDSVSTYIRIFKIVLNILLLFDVYKINVKENKVGNNSSITLKVGIIYAACYILYACYLNIQTIYEMINYSASDSILSLIYNILLQSVSIAYLLAFTYYVSSFKKLERNK